MSNKPTKEINYIYKITYTKESRKQEKRNMKYWTRIIVFDVNKYLKNLFKIIDFLIGKKASIMCANIGQQKSIVIILKSNKQDFREKSITKEKDDFIMIEGSVY